MEPIASTDVIRAEYGMEIPKAVFVQPDSSLTDMPALSVLMGRLGETTLRAVNVRFPQSGMELPV